MPNRLRLLVVPVVAALITGCTAAERVAAAGVLAQVLAEQPGKTGSTTSIPGSTTTVPGSTPTSPVAWPSVLPSILPSTPSLPGGAIAGEAMDAKERKLFDLIMAYRAEVGLPAIPASPAMTKVAHAHVEDLQANRPDEEGDCNLHSWSAKGPWTPMCYTDDHAEAEAMWSKPKEIAGYPGSGYEISYKVMGASVEPEDALEGWKDSPGHNSVMVNQDIWADTEWGAMGVGISANYAVVWFGKEPG